MSKEQLLAAAILAGLGPLMVLLGIDVSDVLSMGLEYDDLLVGTFNWHELAQRLIETFK